MTAAAGTTHPKGGTFGGTTAQMVPITTSTEETLRVQDVRNTGWNIAAGVLEPSGVLDGPNGVWGTLKILWWVLKSSCVPVGP